MSSKQSMKKTQLNGSGVESHFTPMLKNPMVPGLSLSRTCRLSLALKHIGKTNFIIIFEIEHFHANPGYCGIIIIYH
jgi:hypothetical protein